MRPAMQRLSISAVRADALFVSALQRSQAPSAGQVRQAVTAAVRAFGSRGCAERVAQEFGDHPEAAAARMRWARVLAGETFGASGRVPPSTGQQVQPPLAQPPLAQAPLAQAGRAA